MDSITLTQATKTKAIELGFDQVGVAAAEKINPAAFTSWLKDQHHGYMDYLSRQFDLRLDPSLLMPGAKTVLVLALNYYHPGEGPGAAIISRYAWGEDYHLVLRRKLKPLLVFMNKLVPGSEGRFFADSGPVMEKYWAARAGIGWQGKHSLILSPQFGSWIFLGIIITNLELVPDSPIEDRCGSCRRCIEACPTGAIVRPYVVDARKCIAYNTIELSPDQQFPQEIAGKMGEKIFGCDICQQACPWNEKKSITSREPAFRPRQELLRMTLKDYQELDEVTFARLFNDSAIGRIKYAGLKRTLRVMHDRTRLSQK